MTSKKDTKIDAMINNLDKKKSYIKDIMTYLPLSRMPEEEKHMWMSMIQYMEISHLEKLVDILKREI